MFAAIKKALIYTPLILLVISCYSPSTLSSSNYQYDPISKSLYIGDSTFLTNDTIWRKSDLLVDGIHRRKVTYRNHRQLAKVVASGSGKIYVNVCVDREGVPAFVRIEGRTTIKDRDTQYQALRMISGYRFEAAEEAPEYQCGMIKLFLDINAFK